MIHLLLRGFTCIPNIGSGLSFPSPCKSVRFKGHSLGMCPFSVMTTRRIQEFHSLDLVNQYASPELREGENVELMFLEFSGTFRPQRLRPSSCNETSGHRSSSALGRRTWWRRGGLLSLSLPRTQDFSMDDPGCYYVTIRLVFRERKSFDVRA